MSEWRVVDEGRAVCKRERGMCMWVGRNAVYVVKGGGVTYRTSNRTLMKSKVSW